MNKLNVVSLVMPKYSQKTPEENVVTLCKLSKPGLQQKLHGERKRKKKILECSITWPIILIYNKDVSGL